MSPQERDEFNKMKQELAELKDLFFKGDFPDRKVFYKKLVPKGGLDLSVDSVSAGTTSGVIGLYGVTPVVQASAIAAPAGGATVDSEARTTINLIRTAIKNIGVTL